MHLRKGGNITNQCAVGESKRCELIHTFSLQLILILHTIEREITPVNLHLVQDVESELVITDFVGCRSSQNHCPRLCNCLQQGTSVDFLPRIQCTEYESQHLSCGQSPQGGTQALWLNTQQETSLPPLKKRYCLQCSL